MFVKTNSCAVPRTSLVSCESNIDTWLIAVNLSKKPMQEILSYLNFEKKERSEEGSSRSYNELIVQKEFKPLSCNFQDFPLYQSAFLTKSFWESLRRVFFLYHHDLFVTWLSNATRHWWLMYCCTDMGYGNLLFLKETTTVTIARVILNATMYWHCFKYHAPIISINLPKLL